MMMPIMIPRDQESLLGQVKMGDIRRDGGEEGTRNFRLSLMPATHDWLFRSLLAAGNQQARLNIITIISRDGP